MLLRQTLGGAKEVGGLGRKNSTPPLARPAPLSGPGGFRRAQAVCEGGVALGGGDVGGRLARLRPARAARISA